MIGHRLQHWRVSIPKKLGEILVEQRYRTPDQLGHSGPRSHLSVAPCPLAHKPHSPPPSFPEIISSKWPSLAKHPRLSCSRRVRQPARICIGICVSSLRDFADSVDCSLLLQAPIPPRARARSSPTSMPVLPCNPRSRALSVLMEGTC